MIFNYFLVQGGLCDTIFEKMHKKRAFFQKLTFLFFACGTSIGPGGAALQGRKRNAADTCPRPPAPAPRPRPRKN